MTYSCYCEFPNCPKISERWTYRDDAGIRRSISTCEEHVDWALNYLKKVIEDIKEMKEKQDGNTIRNDT